MALVARDVIPSEARDLLVLCNGLTTKQIPRPHKNCGPRNDTVGAFFGILLRDSLAKQPPAEAAGLNPDSAGSGHGLRPVAAPYFSKNGRSLRYVVARSSGSTRVSPTVVTKLVSPVQRGRT